MRESIFECSQTLQLPIDQVFPFFAEARNLGRITPPWLRFEVLTPEPIAVAEGTLIDYRLRWHGLPIPWRSEISVWEPPQRFVDRQLRGPYRLWVHEHRFEDQGGSTVVHDRVRYAVPGGRLIDALFVRRDVERIFAYRRQCLEALAKVGELSSP